MKKITLLLSLLCVTTLIAQSTITEENYIIYNDSIELPGTLTYNAKLKKQPLAIFIHGSGNVDRNGNQNGLSGANYIKQLSEALNQNGIAFYRYDKRTANLKNMAYLMKGISFNAFVEDAELAIEKLKDDKRFSNITIIGHSQGSLVGMLASKKHVTKYVSLAGPSESFDTTIIKQVRQQNGDSIANILQNHFKELNSTGSIKKLDPNFAGMFNPINQKFFKSYNHYIPKEEIKKVNIPTLILNGTKDLQVLENDANALYNAKPNAQLKLIDNMNHVLKTITKDEDNLTSYSKAEFPLSKELVHVITNFIKK